MHRDAALDRSDSFIIGLHGLLRIGIKGFESLIVRLSDFFLQGTQGFLHFQDCRSCVRDQRSRVASSPGCDAIAHQGLQGFEFRGFVI